MIFRPFVLGSHVRHVAVFAFDLDDSGMGRWVPLCEQRRPTGLPWRIAATPNDNARTVCANCVRKSARIAEAVR